ncbi:MAG: hypothetical protein ACI4KR_11780 [Ruminiclostridium sp.]
MLKNGLKKEFMLFSRTGKLIGVILVILIFSIMDPIIFKGMGAMVGAMANSIPADSGAELTEYMQTVQDMASMFDSFSASYLVATSIAEVTGLGLIILMFILMSAAGGEQKKRSIIIPQCAGLTPAGYIAPKFLIYPFAALILSVLGVYLSSGVSSLLFGGSLDMGKISLAALCLGIYMAFISVLQLSIGICTGRPGVSVIIVIIATSLIPMILSSLRVDRFNPFALTGIASNAAISAGGEAVGAVSEAAGGSFASITSMMESLSASAEVDGFNMAVSIGVTIVISVILYFMTLFVLTARQVKNEGNEPVL